LTVARLELRRLTIPVGGLGFPALAAGPDDGELVLLLHGFPQDATAFADVLPLLAARGLRAVAVTQRGYRASNRSRSLSDYTVPALAADILTVADALGAERFSVVGHDLGGLLAWHLAATTPARIQSLTAVSTPHPAAFRRALVGSAQALRSVYMPLFMTPVLSRVVLGARDGLLLRAALRRSGLEAERAGAYVDRLERSGGLRSALRWYRALALSPPLALPDVTVPTTYVWGDGDKALGRAAAEGTRDHVVGPYRFEILEGTSHWIPEEQPRALAELVVDRVGT
jgi:pimeloyl-ACP methyl ester carboxylesterase